MSLPDRRLKVLPDQQPSGNVNIVRFSSTGEYCLTAGTDKTIKLWNPHKASLIKTFGGGHSYDIHALALTQDHSYFVSGGMDKSLVWWDVREARVIKRWAGHYQRVNALDVNKDGTLILSASYDASVKLWDIRTRQTQCVQTLSEAKDSVSSVYLSEQNDIFTGSIDGSVRRYDVRRGMMSEYRLSAPVTYCRPTKDGACVLVSALDGAMRLIDCQTGDLLNHFEGHTNNVYRIESTFSNKEQHVVSGTDDGWVYFWDLVDGEIVHQIHAHHRPLLTVDYHPTENMFLTGSADGHVILWGTGAK
jgi:mitogen-activated protein kinase organizer 1